MRVVHASLAFVLGRRFGSLARPGRVRRSHAFALTLVVLAVLGVSGCASRDQLNGSSSAATTAQSSPLALVSPMPTTLEGTRFDTRTLSGKPVVLWFWAPWCTICRGEAPTVVKIAAEFTGRVRFIGVAGQDTVPAMKAFVSQTGTAGLTHLADVSGAIWRDYGVSVQPSFAFITPDGTAKVRVGSLDEGPLRARVAELAAGAASSTVTMTPGLYCSRAPDGREICGASGPPPTATPSGTTTATR